MKRACIAAFAAATALSAAAETYDTTGVGSGRVENVVHQVAEGHLIIESTNHYDSMEMSDADNPLASAGGPCLGMIEVKNGIAAGGGNCIFTDSEGDMFTNFWTVTGMAPDGALVGHWTVTGGSGKFESASGGGAFHSLSDPATGSFRNEIRGAIHLP